MSRTKPLFGRVAILGIGLIGSSIARAIKRRHLAALVAGFDRNKAALKAAKPLGFSDSLTNSAPRAVKDADLVILATPVGAFGPLAKAIAPHLKAGAIVSDVGSVKGSVIADVAPFLP